MSEEFSFKKATRLLCLNGIFIALIATVLCSRYLSTVNLDDWSRSAVIYTESFAFFHFTLLCFLVTFIIGLIPAVFKQKKAVLATTFLINGLLLTFLLADTFVYQQFRLHLNIAMLQMTFFGGGQVVPMSATMIAQVCALIAACFALGGAVLWAAGKASDSRHSIVPWMAVIVAGFTGCNLWYGYSYAKHYSEYTDVAELIPTTSPLRYNKFLVKHGFVSAQEAAGVKISAGNNKRAMNYPLNPLTCNNTKQYNVVFLYVDALRADMLNEENMPNTWEFSKQAVRFTDHWSGGINTRHGIFTVFTGLPGSYWQKSLSTKTPSILIQALQKEGYEIETFAGATLTMPEFNQTVFAGLDNIRLNSRGASSADRDLACVEDFEKWLASQSKEKPFFGFIFFDNVHAIDFHKDEKYAVYKPYWETVNQLELNNDFDRTPYFNRYKNAVRFADDNVGKVLKLLKDSGHLEDTIVIISSDHGEEFNDNKLNYWGHNGNFTEYQAKVPMVVYWPGKAPAVIDYRTSALDIAPTILTEALGCTNPTSDYSAGHSVWNMAERDFVYCSNYSKDAFIEQNRITQIDEKGVLSFLNPDNRKAKDTSMPTYLNQILMENTRFLK